MKTTTTILILFLAVITLSAQDITGKWSGALTVQDQMGQNVTLRLNFNISKTDNGYTSTMDSPDQGAMGLPVDSTLYSNQELTIKIAQFDFLYEGKVVDKTNMEGSITQMGQTRDLNMKKVTE